jgi:hypothetical protein
VADRFWQPAEVEALIPALTGIMERVMRAHAEAGAVRQRLRAEQERIAMSGGGVADAGLWRPGRARLASLAEQIQSGVQEVVQLGGVPKDLDLGLVDFPHVRDGRPVNLCWKFGERAIAFWHGLDEGYGGRKPL